VRRETQPALCNYLNRSVASGLRATVDSPRHCLFIAVFLLISLPDRALIAAEGNEGPLEIVIIRDTGIPIIGKDPMSFTMTLENTSSPLHDGSLIFIPGSSLLANIRIHGISMVDYAASKVFTSADWAGAERDIQNISRAAVAFKILLILGSPSTPGGLGGRVLQGLVQVAQAQVTPNPAVLALIVGANLDGMSALNDELNPVLQDVWTELFKDEDSEELVTSGILLFPGQKYVVQMKFDLIDEEAYYLGCRVPYKDLHYIWRSGLEGYGGRIRAIALEIQAARQLGIGKKPSDFVSSREAKKEVHSPRLSQNDLDNLQDFKQSDLPTPETTGQIHILVYDQASRDQQRPDIECVVEGADITLSRDREVVDSKKTDDIGSCMFENVPFDMYTIIVYAPGYERPQPRSIVLDEKSSRDYLEIGLKKASSAQIQVHVYDKDAMEEGVPTKEAVIEGANVALFGTGEAILLNRNTDAIGLCILGDYPFGYYKVAVTCPGYEPGTETFDLDSSVGSGWRTVGLRRSPTPSDEGMLDVVLLIDKSGSMVDDIEIVKQEVDSLLGEMSGLAEQQNISLQVALITFAYMGKGQNLFEVSKLSPDTGPLRKFITTLSTQSVGGDEDLYSAMMYAMNEPVEGKQIDIGWRSRAAKITIPITDEAPKEDNFTLFQVAQIAEALDPVHVYPLVTPKGTLGWLGPAENTLGQLAKATGGRTIQVSDAEAVPKAIISAMKLAIRRHKEEIWRKAHPPYLLYGVLASLGFLALAAIGTGVVAQRRSLARRRVLASVSRSSVDHTLTGESYIRPPDESHNSTRGEIQ
jgi:hypothetical protein